MPKSGSPLVLLLIALVYIVSCDESARMERKAPEDVSLAKSIFELLRGGHYDQVRELMNPALQDAAFRSDIDGMVAAIPAENASAVKTSSVDVLCEEGSCESHIIVEYRYKTERLLFNVVLQKETSRTTIAGMHVRIIPESLIKANEFTLLKKTFPQYLILSLAMLFPAFSLYVLALCLWSKIGPRKWVWACFILIGVGRLGIDWTNGQLDFQFLAIQVLSAGAFAFPYGPWDISISLPLGAILFLANHRDLLLRIRERELQERSAKPR